VTAPGELGPRVMARAIDIVVLVAVDIGLGLVMAWVWIAMRIRSSLLRQGPHDLLAGGTRVVQR